jgi:protein FAM32A
LRAREGNGGGDDDDEGAEHAPKLPRYEEAKTPAERRFEEMQRRREEQEAKKIGNRSHRERVDEFNSKLDRLPTHFDIPKVGPG